MIFSTKGGSSEVFLTGYWEPSPDLGDDQIGLDQIGFDPAMMEEDDDEPADPATEENIKQAQQNAQMNVDLNPDSSSSDDEAAVMQQIQEQKKKKQGKKDQPKKEQVKSAPPAKKAPPRKESSSSSDEAPPAKPAAPA